MELYKKYIFALFALTVFIYLIFSKSLQENFNTIYRHSNLKTEIKFDKINIGLNTQHKLNFPYPEKEINYYNETLIHSAMPNSFTITDLNQDEFVDVCTSNPDYDQPVRCFLNQKGEMFTEVTNELGLNKKVRYLPSSIYSADFNNDGLADLLIVNYGKHQLLLRDKKIGFIETENDWFSNAWGANLSDFNNDGLIDIIFANYFARTDLTENKIPWVFTGIADTKFGDFNEIWINKGNGKFEVDLKLFKDTYKEHTTAIGVADFNKDGLSDIIATNDYSVDRMYQYNKQTQSYEEKTEQTIPKAFHGYSGMNTEFYDFNKDGFLDIYVSNIVIPPLLGASNILWIWNQQKNIFEQQAAEQKVDRCGYSWTAKSVDFNLDGTNEIIAASGFFTTETGKINLLFYRLVDSSTPKWFKNHPMAKNVNDFAISTQSRPCLFYKKDNSYHDISESAIEWNNFRASRSLTVFDFNNDGKTDIIIPEHNGLTQTYANNTPTNNNWVGLFFVNKHNSPIQFGIKAELFDENNQSLEYFEINPTNGFKSQNDYRKIIGLNNKKNILLKVYNQLQITEHKLTLNKYNEIKIY